MFLNLPDKNILLLPLKIGRPKIEWELDELFKQTPRDYNRFYDFDSFYTIGHLKNLD